MATRARLIDVSHVVEHGMVTYKGLPGPVVSDHLTREASRQLYEAGTEFHIGRIDLVANTGTYLDAPFHRFADGLDVADVPLEAVAEVPGVLVRAPHEAGLAVDTAAFAGLDVRGRAVLVHTGWDAHWRTPRYYEDHPFLTADAAAHLAAAGAVLVGIDSHNIDDTRRRSRPVHTTLLRAGVFIVEHLCNLAAVPERGFRFTAAPVRVRGLGTFPVRAFVSVEDL
jgi:kynurenine formamidase